MKCWKQIIAIILVFYKLFSISPVLALSDSFNVNLGVEAETAVVCDNDGTCETGETESNCSNDCGCNNNGSCETARGETSANCPNDCPVVIYGGELPDTDAPIISDIVVFNITLTTASISWKTTEPAKCQLFLGKTLDYETSIVSESLFLRDHLSSFISLSNSTLYNFKIACWDFRNNKRITPNYSFSTLSLPDTTPPSNVSNFQASSSDQTIPLTWENPVDEDLAGVVIVRGDDFYPQRPWEGTPVYDGPLEGVEDLNLVNGQNYYYTAFTYDRAGNYSSGAVVSGIPLAPGAIRPPAKPPVGEPTGIVPSEIEGLKFSDFEFFQKGNPLSILTGNRILISDDAPLTALIRYEKVPEVLKTILVSLEQDGKYFSFLLRVNEDKTDYQAKLAPPPPGKYPVVIYVLDYKNQALKKLEGMLEIKAGAMMPQPSDAWWKTLWAKLQDERWLLIFLLIFITILLIIYYLIKRKQAKKEEEYLQ